MGDYQNIINTVVEEALMRGLADGRAEGMEKGMEKERMANAAKMKELGVDVAFASCVGEWYCDYRDEGWRL